MSDLEFYQTQCAQLAHENNQLYCRIGSMGKRITAQENEIQMLRRKLEAADSLRELYSDKVQENAFRRANAQLERAREAAPEFFDGV